MLTKLNWQNNKRVSYPFKRMISIPSHHLQNYCSRGNYCFIYCHVFMLQEIRDVRVLVRRSSHHLFPVLWRDPLSPLQEAPFHLFIYDFIMKKASFHLFMYVFIMKKPPSTSSCICFLWRNSSPTLRVCLQFEKALATLSWMQKKRNTVKLLHKILLSPCKKVTNTKEKLCTNTHTLCFWLNVGEVISHVLGFCSTGGWAKEDLSFLSKNDWKDKALHY